MSIYHLFTGIVQRSKGHSAIAGVAYQSGELLDDERTGIAHDFRVRQGVAHTEIIAAADAPDWVYQRPVLWNAVEQANRRGDAQLCFNMEAALPIELDLSQQILLVKNFLAPWIARGQVADFAIHNPVGNPHVHIKTTMNAIEPNGFGKKVREWNAGFSAGKVSNTDALEADRKRWAECCNQALSDAGFEDAANLSAESNADRGILELPTEHQGRAARYGNPSPRNPSEKSMQQTIQLLNRIKAEETRIHLLINSFETELMQAKEEQARLLQTESHTEFAATLTPVPRNPAQGGFELPRAEPPSTPSTIILLPDKGW